ncbi:undecaprenyl-diphosphatase [Kineosphaera limosa]|uniref:Phosphatidic acid phosphatase type 2/haloperoxidase domain-containing protein n=1 Tax=Kineosphaera limosa NBRC 100340 TaxID=1184609 RepID=K6XCZ3_9MICO|nr:phosphatase PAP2 family protein [Kineosphaera limosa]NYE01527.1 undecaprenyl-diphosphatase [Kineosphaera limosa]GAB96684.1 hypothetical protein KILIM_045_00150 [Kineosphaera limosa NBRC 100340]
MSARASDPAHRADATGLIRRWPKPTVSPTPGHVARQLLRYAVLPGLLVWAAIVALGLLIMGPLGELQPEEVWSQRIAAWRSPLWDTLTDTWSTSTDTWFTIGSAVVLSLVLLWLTRRWWVGMVPLLAITVESTIFVTATHVVGRPRPEVTRPDPAPPTSSFPSGHAAAAMALWLSIALLSLRIERAWIRVPIVAFAVALPLLVAFARYYRGAHHISDIVVGMLLGVFCAVTAVRAVRETRQAPHEEPFG